MKTIRKEKIETVLRELRDALESATMEKAGFHSPDIKGSSEQVTEVIRKATELYRGSWIISPLERAIETLKGELERKFGGQA